MPKKKHREDAPPPGSEQPDESMLEELDQAPLVQPQVVDGKIVETWVPPAPRKK